MEYPTLAIVIILMERMVFLACLIRLIRAGLGCIRIFGQRVLISYLVCFFDKICLVNIIVRILVFSFAHKYHQLQISLILLQKLLSLLVYYKKKIRMLIKLKVFVSYLSSIVIYSLLLVSDNSF